MSRQSYSISVVVDIPQNVPADNVVAALHDHSGVMRLQPLVTATRSVPPSENMSSSESAHFRGTGAQNLSHYELDETVTIVPGVGDLGKKYLTFPARWQDTPDGARSWANAPQGITVATEWTVRPKEGESGTLVLEEKATVECSMFLMPFVWLSFKPAHRDMDQKLVDKVARSIEGDKQEVPVRR